MYVDRPYLHHNHTVGYDLKLRLPLRLRQNRLHLRRFHHIALDLELALHEQVLRVRLAGHQFGEVSIIEDKRD
jgi:hypothetical protein